MVAHGWRFWIALGVSALLLLLLLYRVDVGDIGKALQDANYIYLA